MKKIITGIVGLGRSGWDIHINALRRDPRYEIAAVCDSDRGRLKEAKEKLGCSCYKNYHDFIQHPGLELVIIASPTKEHFWMTKAALLGKKNVVLEKPLTPALSEARQLKKIALNNRCILSPYYNFRFSNDFIKIRSVIQKGLIGKIFLIKRQVGYFNRRDDWQSKLSSSGGILNAAAIHSVDQVIQLLGQLPVKIWRDLQKVVSKGDASDHAKIMLNFPDKCVADIEMSWAEALNGCDWLIYGSRGAIKMQDGTLEIKWFLEKEVKKGIPKKRSYLSGERINWHKKRYHIGEGFSGDYYNKLYTAIKYRGLPPVSLDSAIQTMAVIDKIENLKPNR